MIKTIQIVMASLGIINCLLVAIFLLLVKKGNLKANRTLGFLLISVCLKLNFALLNNYPHEWGIATRLMFYLSEVGYLLFGPLLLLYVRTFLKKETSIFLTVSFVSIAFVFTFFDIILNYNYSLWPCQVYFFIFLIATFQQILYTAKENNKSAVVETNKFWLWSLSISFVLIWIAVSLILINFDLYFVELCSIFTVLFYINSYILIKHYWLNRGDVVVSKKYVNSNLTSDEENEIILKLRKLMDDESLYADSELSLPKVADRINVKPYKLSQVINQSMNMTFNEYINFYRINAIKNAIKLSDQSVKISSIAGDYGFNSISSFNTAFKKFTKLTPSQYRNEIIMNNQN